MSLLYFFKLMQHIAPCKSLLAHIPSSPPLVQLSPSQPSYEEAMHRTRLLLEIENTSKIFSSRGRGNSTRTRTRTRIHTRPCSSHYSPEKNWCPACKRIPQSHNERGPWLHKCRSHLQKGNAVPLRLKSVLIRSYPRAGC